MAQRTGIPVGVVLLAAAAWLATAQPAQADWPTHRGNAHRTGCLDGRGGPAAPVVLWAYTAQEHYVASPVIDGHRVYLAGLGAFNTGVFHAVDLAVRSEKRVAWSAAAPFVTRPTVSAPATGNGLVIFGDGMHQTDDAILYCLQASDGMPLWRLDVPGKLIHMEGAPTLAAGRVYIGGGDAGVLCVDATRVVLDGKEMDLPGATEIIAKRREELLAKYEKDKQTNGQFAVAPGPEALPKAAPKLLWQAGAKQWHVDAPTAIVRDRVLAASAYLDDEKIGKRCLLCLRSRDGTVRWELPLEINPWAGPTVADDATVLVACSSIRYDPHAVKQAKGEVVAVNFNDGKVRWRRALGGGVLSAVAVADGLAVAAATDGKLYALDLGSGEPRWTHQAAAPFFGAAALAGGVAYVADLNGTLHAVRLFDGKQLWALDVLADKGVLAPGMVLGSPVVHGGRIYLASCNALSKRTDLPSALVCVGDRAEAADLAAAVKVQVDKAAGTVTVPCRIAPRKLPNLNEIYPIEVMATYPAPRGQKAHETVVTFEVTPSEVHKALESLGLKPGSPAKGAVNVARGPLVEIFLALDLPGGMKRALPIERTLIDRRTGKPLSRIRWMFTGSADRLVGEGKQSIYGADAGGTLIALFPVTDETVFQSSFTMREEGMLKLDTDTSLLPPEGTRARLIIETRPRPVEPAAAAPADQPFAYIQPLRPLLGGPLPCARYALGDAVLRQPLPPARPQRLELLSWELLRPLPLRPEADEPPLAAPPWSLRSARRHLPTVPAPRIESPSLAGQPLLPPDSLYDAGGEEAERSPGQPGRDTALRSRPTPGVVHAPLLTLHIPDPFEADRALAMEELAPEQSGPAEPRRDTLPRPVLPVPPPPPPPAKDAKPKPK